MIMQIIVLLIASIGAAATLKQDLCISPMAPSFSTVCCQCNLSPERDRILSAGGNDGGLDPCPGLVREGDCGVWRTAKPSPPHHLRGDVCNTPHDPGVSGEGIRRRSEGKMEMKFMMPMQFLSLVLGGSTDSSVAGLNLFVFWGDDHGGEAVVGRRDADWASGRSAITSSLLLSVLWAVGTFCADQNGRY